MKHTRVREEMIKLYDVRHVGLLIRIVFWNGFLGRSQWGQACHPASRSEKGARQTAEG